MKEVSFNLSRTHFLLKLLGGMVLYWATVWTLKMIYYGDRLLPAEYIWLAILIPAAALTSFATRGSGEKCLCGLSRARISAITQREILFLLGFVLGFLVMTKDDRHSRVFLALFVCADAVWIAWMNRPGHRKLHRFLNRNRRSWPGGVISGRPAAVVAGR